MAEELDYVPMPDKIVDAIKSVGVDLKTKRQAIFAISTKRMPREKALSIAPFPVFTGSTDMRYVQGRAGWKNGRTDREEARKDHEKFGRDCCDGNPLGGGP